MVSLRDLRARREDQMLQQQLRKALKGVDKHGAHLKGLHVSRQTGKRTGHMRRTHHKDFAALKPSDPKSQVVRWSDLYGIFGNVPGHGQLSKDNVVLSNTRRSHPVIMTPRARWARAVLNGEYPAVEDYYDRILMQQST